VATALILASVRTGIADFLSTVIYIYTLLIFLYVVLQLLLQLGLRIPYSRSTDAILTFLRDVCEPFLRLIRRVIPPFGAIDLSPLIAIILLQLVNSLIVQELIA
jgi:YggT family protein